MKIFHMTLIGAAAVSVLLAGCSTPLKPNYTTTNPELIRIGGEKPVERSAEIMNTGTYCLRISHIWKSDTKTPDGDTIWTMDTFRKATACKQ
ncbi:conserved exported hypothetical protein [Gammaproteobacteria bacterium]